MHIVRRVHERGRIEKTIGNNRSFENISTFFCSL